MISDTKCYLSSACWVLHCSEGWWDIQTLHFTVKTKISSLTCKSLLWFSQSSCRNLRIGFMIAICWDIFLSSDPSCFVRSLSSADSGAWARVWNITDLTFSAQIIIKPKTRSFHYQTEVSIIFWVLKAEKGNCCLFKEGNLMQKFRVLLPVTKKTNALPQK